MKGCLVALAIVVGLVASVYVFLASQFGGIHVRYRLTVEVQDGDRVETGSSVIEALYDLEPAWSPSGPNNHTNVIGYEPTVDLGGKGLLFLTFSDASRTPAQRIEQNKQLFCQKDDVYCLPFAAYQAPGTGVETAKGKQREPLEELLRQSGPREVSFAVLPELVRFRDIDDPLTRTTVSPNDLAAAFGPGVILKRVILQLTNDPITPRPEIWPLWLKQSGRRP